MSRAQVTLEGVPAKSKDQEIRWGREQCAKNLNFYHQVLWLILRIEAGWLPGVVHWAWKQTIGDFIWQDAQQVQNLRVRLVELRYPLKRFEKEDASVRSLVMESANVSDDTLWLAGFVLELKALLAGAIVRHLEMTLDVADYPSVEILLGLGRELNEQIRWAESAIEAQGLTGIKMQEVSVWRSYLRAKLQPLFGDHQNPQQGGDVEPPLFRRQFHPVPEAKRGNDVLMHGPGDLLIKDNRCGVPDIVITEFRNYCQEMMAAETLGTIMYEVENMPWEFYYDSARHLHDEVRHSKLGVDRLQDFGIGLKEVPQTAFYYAQRMKLSALERYAVLTMIIEAPCFPELYARQKSHLERNDFKSAEYVGYDIADETMHVKFGNKWLPVMMERIGEKRSFEDFIKYCDSRWKELTPDYSTQHHFFSS